MKAVDLRKSILQAAVQGKLVPQNPHDEPASNLLERIRDEKERLIKEGKIKKEKSLPPITEDDVQYDLPEGWVCCRLGEVVVQNIGGGTPLKSVESYWNGNIKWASVKDLNSLYLTETQDSITEEGLNNSSSNIIPKGNVIVCTRMGLGKITINEIDVAINQDLRGLFLTENINKLYFINFYRTISVTGNGMTVKGISIEELHNIILPLPPLAEQQRIVAKIDELMKLCDELEAIEKQLDEIENHFAEFLSKSILQAAVKGKLLPQIAYDEPATDLLQRIRAEKVRLMKEGNIKKEKPLPPITGDEIPYDLPEGWMWCRLGEICYNSGQKKPDRKFTYIDVSSIDNLAGKLNNISHILEPDKAPSRARKLVQKGTVIYSTVRPYLNNVAIIDKDFEFEPIVSTAFAILHPCIGVLNKFLFYYLRSETFGRYVKEQMIGLAYPAINDEKFFKGLFPLPPLAEQHRIVATVDELMKLCDELKNIEDFLPANIVPFPAEKPEQELRFAARTDGCNVLSPELQKEIQADLDELFSKE